MPLATPLSPLPPLPPSSSRASYSIPQPAAVKSPRVTQSSHAARSLEVHGVRRRKPISPRPAARQEDGDDPFVEHLAALHPVRSARIVLRVEIDSDAPGMQ